MSLKDPSKKWSVYGIKTSKKTNPELKWNEPHCTHPPYTYPAKNKMLYIPFPHN